MTTLALVLCTALWYTLQVAYANEPLMVRHLSQCTPLVFIGNENTDTSTSQFALCPTLEIDSVLVGQVCFTVFDHANEALLNVTVTSSHPDYLLTAAHMYVGTTHQLEMYSPSNWSGLPHTYAVCENRLEMEAMNEGVIKGCMARSITYILTLPEVFGHYEACNMITDKQQSVWDLFAITRADVTMRNDANNKLFDATLNGRAVGQGCVDLQYIPLQMTCVDPTVNMTHVWQPGTMELARPRSVDATKDDCFPQLGVHTWGWSHPPLENENAYTFDMFVASERCDVDALGDPNVVPIAQAHINRTYAGRVIAVTINLSETASRTYPHMSIENMYLFLSCEQLKHASSMSQSQFMVHRTFIGAPLINQTVAFVLDDISLEPLTDSLLANVLSEEMSAITYYANTNVSLPLCAETSSAVYFGLQVHFVLLS